MTTSKDTIGLIAGNGIFPILFAQAARRAGLRIVAVGMRGETRSELASYVDELNWVRVGQIGRMLRHFHRAKVSQAAMAGGIDKRRLFQKARPDWLGLKLLAQNLIRRDDGMLRALAQAFESAGVTIVDSTLFMPDALAPAGVLTSQRPSQQHWQDLKYGLNIAQAIGRLDIGQTVVVRQGAVVALEAIEGTDACIERAGILTNYRGATVVKTAKPDQDMRFDVPAIGIKTLEVLHRSGIDALGIEAGRTLLLEPQRLLRKANELGLIVVGLQSNCTSHNLKHLESNVPEVQP